ncbi:MAG: protease pro-enzyme activation domain-containing protein, partial [Limisphaerales bacterium]
MNAKLFLDVENWFQKFNCFLLSGLALAAFLFGITARAAEPQLVHAGQPWVAARLTPISPLGENNRLNLAIALPLRNESALSNLLQQIYDPASPNFHHFLTPEQFTEQFGPSEADYQAVVDFAKASGFQVTATHPNRMLLDVNGPVSAIEKALHVTMHLYQHPTENRTFYAPDTDPTVDLSVPLLHISGLNNYELPHPRLVVKPLESGQSPNPNAGSGPGGTYMGKDFRAAYVPDTSLNGSGQTVGLLQFDGYTSNDIAYYEQKNGLPAVTLTNVLLDGFGGRPTGDGGEVEVSLDIELSISMATNLSKVIVYEAGPNGDWHDILNRMATDDLAKQLSCSWYNPGGAADPVADQIWQEMAMQGQSFLNASGDDDAYTGLISFPGDSPYITQVGGTTLNTTGPAGSWVSESVWNWEKGIGSGGGVSAQYPIPGWQTNVSMAANQGSTTMRNTPDVALTADNVYVRADGFDYNVGGTSCAAPLWAGFTALVNQEAVASGQSTVGFLNPLVYAIGGKAAYTADFHDIITGNNESPSSPDKFSAVPGYDLCTGWGTPAGQKLIDALANPEPLIITPAAGFSSIGGVGGPFTVTYESFTLTNAGTNNLTWTLANTSSWLNVSSVGGALTAGGPATNLIVSLNTVASNLTLGTYTATIAFTNLNDNIGQAREFSLDIIAAPEITLQPTNEAVLDGDSVTFAAQTAGGVPQYYQWQFDGTNLVDGDGIFGSESTNLVITVASTNDVGVYNLVVSNAAGVLVSSNADLSLILSPPIITEQPANETAGENSTAEFSISAVGTKPIAYQWIFNETNIIDGATNAALILSQVQFTNAGDYSVTLTNIYGSTNSAPAVLTVTPCDPAPSGIVSWWAAEGNAYDQISGYNGAPIGNVTYGPGVVG